ncbi:MAG: hypothetical protein Q9227_001098 [Pyrenula ochraceoflavens]
MTTWSSTIKAAFDHHGHKQVSHVAKSGSDKDGKYFIVLKDLDQDACFVALDNIMQTSLIPGSKQYRGKKAAFPKNLDLYAAARVHRAGMYLGTDYITRICTSIMRRISWNLITRAEAEGIYVNFPAKSLARQMVIESITEECLSEVLNCHRDSDEVWYEVFTANFDGIKDLEQETSRHYYAQEGMRLAKRRQLAQKRRGAY